LDSSDADSGYIIYPSKESHLLHRVEDYSVTQVEFKSQTSAKLGAVSGTTPPPVHAAVEITKALHRKNFGENTQYFVPDIEVRTSLLVSNGGKLLDALSVSLDSKMRRGITRSIVQIGTEQAGTIYFWLRES
jgi:hypothetical protein